MIKLYLQTSINLSPDQPSATAINLWNNSDFVVSNIEGLRIGEKDLAVSTMPYKDGDTVQNISGAPRDVTIEIKPTKDNGDFSQTYDLFSKYLGKEVYLFWQKRKTADGDFSMVLEGIMTECEMPMFSEDVRMTFTIHCANPYWYKPFSTIVSDVTKTSIIGTAPPRNIMFVISNGTIPAASKYLRIGNYDTKYHWKLQATSTDLTGEVKVSNNPVSITVANVSHLETVASPLNNSNICGEVRCRIIDGLAYTELPFTIRYNPQWY